MSTLRITQTRSAIGSQVQQKRTLSALGLRRIGDAVERADRAEIRGMIAKVAHLVTVESVAGKEAEDTS